MDDIAAKMTAVLSNPALRDELRRHGLEQAKNFSWALSAKRAIEFFERQVDVTSNALSPAARPIDDAAQYDNFLAALSKLNLGKLDEEFLASVAHVIAANELLTRIESDNYQSELKIGWVTSWRADCDVATYSRRIIGTFPSRPTVFAPYSKDISASGDEPNVIRAWNSGGGDDLAELHHALASAPIDVVVIQYGEGMFELPALATLVKQQKKLNRHVFVTFHSTAVLAALNAETGALEIRAALKSCDGIFLHSMNAVKNLEAFKVRKNVSFLPGLELQHQVGKSVAGDSSVVIANYLMRKMAFAIARGNSG